MSLVHRTLLGVSAMHAVAAIKADNPIALADCFTIELVV